MYGWMVLTDPHASLHMCVPTSQLFTTPGLKLQEQMGHRLELHEVMHTCTALSRSMHHVFDS